MIRDVRLGTRSEPETPVEGAWDVTVPEKGACDVTVPEEEACDVTDPEEEACDVAWPCHQATSLKVAMQSERLPLLYCTVGVLPHLISSALSQISFTPIVRSAGDCLQGCTGFVHTYRPIQRELLDGTGSVHTHCPIQR